MDLDLAIFQLTPTAAYRLNDSKTAILEWRGPGVQPTQQQLTDAWTAFQAAQAAKATDATTLKTAIQSRLAALVGLQWPNMTAVQKAEMVVALLYKVGALDKTLTVQPLAAWL